MNFIDKWSDKDDKYLNKILNNSRADYELPSFDEVKAELSKKEFDDNHIEEYGWDEIVLDDLIIKYIEDGNYFELELC